MRIHGRNGIVYLSVNHGDPATPLAYMSSWAISFTRQMIDVTAITDTQQIWAAGILEASGSFSGYWDDATAQAYTAASDGLPRNMYLYPDAAHMGNVFSGQVLPDLTITGAVNGGVTVASSWVQAGPVTGAQGGIYGDTYSGTYA